jgi:D-alanyl-D-alanine carboxypeptidase
MNFAPILALLATVLIAALPGAAQAGPTLLFDPANGKILYAEDIDDQWHPASLTKMMTAYLVFDAIKDGRLKPDQQIVVSEAAFAQSPSKVGLPVGQTLTVDVAIHALIIKSANDVAMMLAEAVSGSETAFVAEMNRTAKRLGMTRTTFVNPHGLPAAEQVSTARDLARLARAISAEYPQYAPIWAMPDMMFGKTKLRSHNGLLRSFDGADGMKTGFICDSGFNVVASATRNGSRLMSVVLGEARGDDRTIRAASLLEHGFQNYGWKMLFNPKSIDTLPIAADARPIMSMRQSVISWECGTRKRPHTAGLKKGKPKTLSQRVAKAKAEAEKRKVGKDGAKSDPALKPTVQTDAKPTEKAAGETAPKPSKPAVQQAPKPQAEAAKPAPAAAAQ